MAKSGKHDKKKYDYFDTFCDQAGLVVAQSEMLVETVGNFSAGESLSAVRAQASQTRDQSAELLAELLEAVEADFITPLERDDVAQVCVLLDQTVGFFTDIFQRIYMYNVHTVEAPAVAMCISLREEARALQDAVEAFRDFKKREKAKGVKKAVKQVRAIERALDEQYVEAVRALFEPDQPEAVHVVKWKNIYECVLLCSKTLGRAGVGLRTVALANA